MTTTIQPAPDTAGAWTLPELIAQQLSSMHVIGGRLVELVATPGQGHVELSISRPFPPESHLRVLLYLSEPIRFAPGSDTVDAELVDEVGVEIGAQTGAEVGAPA